ncbi:MAG: redox-regulated ATPase YchF [Kiritimatiellae bacterium]|nr:redox-regulated ATPase YchF [Kiritimatiellia bacterium]
MKAGIVGLPNVGKSTLFNALTAAVNAEASNYPFCTIEPNVGAVQVPDSRLETLAEKIDTQEIVPAVLQLVDIAGLVQGASQGEGLGNKFLSHIREVDALLHVVRCFEDGDITHVDGNIDSLRDMETVETELMLADLDLVENALPKLQKAARGGDQEALLRTSILEQCKIVLSEGKPVRMIDIQQSNERKMLHGLGILTAKKVLYIANVTEDDVQGEGAYVQQVKSYAEQNRGQVVAVCAKIESELNELEDLDRQEMLESLGMKEPALHAVAHAAYQLLGLQSFFTAGPKEIKAWTIPVGATAPQAAGVIHTDFERGFIRAEVYQVDDLEKYETEADIKAAGKLRLEGKTYTMQNGDVCHFLFRALHD